MEAQGDKGRNGKQLAGGREEKSHKEPGEKERGEKKYMRKPR